MECDGSQEGEKKIDGSLPIGRKPEFGSKLLDERFGLRVVLLVSYVWHPLGKIRKAEKYATNTRSLSVGNFLGTICKLFVGIWSKNNGKAIIFSGSQGSIVGIVNRDKYQENNTKMGGVQLGCGVNGKFCTSIG